MDNTIKSENSGALITLRCVRYPRCSNTFAVNRVVADLYRDSVCSLRCAELWVLEQDWIEANPGSTEGNHDEID